MRVFGGVAVPLRRTGKRQVCSSPTIAKCIRIRFPCAPGLPAYALNHVNGETDRIDGGETNTNDDTMDTIADRKRGKWSV